MGAAPHPGDLRNRRPGLGERGDPIDWREFRPDPLPTRSQLDGFVADYEAARGQPFAGAERHVLQAAQVWVTPYGARCQHSDDVLRIFPDVDHTLGWPRLLRDLLAR